MSNGMDPYLAELFNTNGHAEKVAYVQNVTGAFIKQAEEEGADLSGIDEEQLVEAALAWAQDMEQGGGEGYDPEYLKGPENLGPKTSEVDFLGRYMAHAYNDELQKIASGGKAGLLRRMGEGIKGGAGKVHEAIVGMGGKIGRYGKNGRGAKVYSKAEKAKIESIPLAKAQMEAGGIKNITKNFREQAAEAGQKAVRRRSAGFGYGALGAGALGVGAAGYGVKKALDKKSHIEALDELAIERANELLKLAGEGYEMGFEDVAATDEDDLDRVITELAWSKLQDEGYIG